MNLIQRTSARCFIKVVMLIVGVFISFLCLEAQEEDSTLQQDDGVVDTAVKEESPQYFDIGSVQADTIELRHVPAYIVDSLKNDDAFWYAKAKLEKKKEQRQVNSRAPRWVKSLVWTIVIGGFLAALIWYLTSSNILIFAKRQKKINPIAREELISEDIFSINYQREIEKAVAAENYRLAVRLMFLKLLRDLSNKKIIQFRSERTNLEYLTQLSPTVYYNDFFRLTRNYEYAWYGKFDVSREAFGAIKNDFENFDRQLK